MIREKRSSIQRSSPSDEKNNSSSDKSRGRWHVFSSFKRLPETPPVVITASLGAPFELEDVEKGIESAERKPSTF